MNNNIFDTDIEFLEKIKLLIELNKFELPSNEQIKIVLKKLKNSQMQVGCCQVMKQVTSIGNF